MTRLVTATLLICILTLSGCKTPFRDKSKPRYTFPSWASAVCYGELNAARDAIRAKGVHSIKAKSLTVRFIKGERQIGGRWAYYVKEPSWKGGGAWIAGMTDGTGRVISMVIDPGRVGDTNAIEKGSLRHEMFHHWLITNGYGSHHMTEYDGIAPGWSYARRVIGWSTRIGATHHGPIVVDRNGTHYNVLAWGDE
jgi:hypothetical protein